MIEVHLVSFMPFMDEAVVAKHTSFIFLTILADPYNVVLTKSVLADSVGGHLTNPLHL